MNVTLKAVLVSAWFAAAITALALTIWGRLAEKNYKAAMSPAFRWLYPAWLREKELNIRFQKGMAWFGLFFVTLVYALAMISVLRGR